MSLTLQVQEYPLRETLELELHARPYQALDAPELLSYLALLSGEYGAEEDRAHLARLCARYNVPPPPKGAKHFDADLGPFRVKWERHTEFCTYTFFRQGAFEDPFAHPVIDFVPKDWLSALPGRILTATHLALEPRDAPVRKPEEIDRLFKGHAVMGSKVSGGAAMVWTDFRVHEDRFARVLVRDISMSRRQAGRLGQRLFELQAYRLMALLALPVARDASPRIRELDERLADVANRLASGGRSEADSELLQELSAIAAAIEDVSASTAYRFGSARAYYELVQRRLTELREERIEGLQTISGFLERRMSPAMRTCEFTASRQDALSRRAARLASLLRARVEVALEEQNRDLLGSMNRRATQQLRLQQTVEGLSVVAISYYLVSLLGYFFKAAKGFGLPINPELAMGLAAPVVIILAWFGLRRARKALFGGEEE